MPTFTPTAARYDEHGLVYGHYGWSAREQKRKELGGSLPADCTHFCQQSSVYRFWTQLLQHYLRPGDENATSP